MKYHPFLLASIFFSAFAIISGCSTTNTTDVTSVQPLSTGQIVGTVTLFEMDCTQSTSSAGVTGTILGTKLTAISDSAGMMTFDSVPAGNYAIQFSKPAFTNYVQTDVPFVGSGTLRDYVNGHLIRINNWKTMLSPPTISKIPVANSLDSEFQFNFPSGVANVLDSSGKIVNLGSGGEIILYFSKNPAINYMDTTTYFTISSGYASGNTNAYLFTNSPSTYPHDGDTVYFVGYPVTECLFPLQYTYYIGDTLKTGYTEFGPPSNTMKVVLP